jgi:hypothetical protein
MKSAYVLIAVSFCLLPLGRAAENSTPKDVPKISFEQTVFDFGKVKSGEVIKHSFVFTNTGSAKLEILEVKPGCGCTTAGTWDKIVEPGKTGSIPLQFNSTGFGGRINKSATVTCNDASRSNVILQITGNVWKPIDLTPNMAMFNFPSEGQTNQTRTIRIVSNLDEPLTLQEPVCTNQAIRVELKTVKPGKEFELAVTALAPISAPSVYAPIKIKTSTKELPEISTTAYVTVLQPLSVIPQQVIIPAGPLATEARSNVTIRNNTTNTVSFSDAAINIPGATVSLKESQPGRLYTLALNIPAGFQADPTQKPEVTVKSSDPKNPVIRIPVFQPRSVIKTPAK